MSKNLGDYIVAWLIIIVVGIGVSFVIGLVAGVLAFIPCCGWILSWILLGSPAFISRRCSAISSDRLARSRPASRSCPALS